MHPSMLFMIVVAAGASPVHGHPAARTPAAQFWEQALPGTPMPEAIADLVQKGIDHSPLVEQYSSSLRSRSSISTCTLLDSICSSKTVAETGVFFHPAQLRPGSTMTLSFPAEANSAAILPHDVAVNVPFGNLDDVLTKFNIPAGSAEAAQVSDTLSRCQAPPAAGEVMKSCTTSLEATVQTAMDMLGVGIGTTSSGSVVTAAASELPRVGLPRQPYVIEKVTQLASDKYVSCHKVPFPYAVYQCHMADKAYGTYKVSLRGYRGGAAQAVVDKAYGAHKGSLRNRGGALQAVAVDMLAFCHLDTSGWNPAHPAFDVLHTKPGTPVCHFITDGNLAFVKKKATSRN